MCRQNMLGLLRQENFGLHKAEKLNLKFIFVFSKQLTANNVPFKICQWQYLNRGTLMSKATALPTEQLPNLKFKVSSPQRSRYDYNVTYDECEK